MSKRLGDPGYAAKWCIHYRAPVRGIDTCEAGVPYSFFKNDSTRSAPCFLDEQGYSKPNAMDCMHLRRPTKQEIEDHNEWKKQRMERLLEVLAAIAPWRKQWTRRSHSEVIACPACKEGRLSLSISLRGHVHGNCSTKGCVSWME